MDSSSSSLSITSANMVLRIISRNRKVKVQEITIETLNQASAIVDRLRLEKGWRSSTMPKCLILVEDVQRGFVSLNGRVWEGDPAAPFQSGRAPIFDPGAAA